MDMEELFLFVESQSTTDNAVTNIGATSDSNDNVLLLGVPDAQTFSSGDTTTNPAAVSNAEDNASFTTSGNSDNGPCSNDNPNYAEVTQPCPGATIDEIFDGATEAPETPGGDDANYPSFYSCNVATEDELANSRKNEIPFSFNYEIYTPTNADDVAFVLSTFERQLANGVASVLGLVDCPELAVEVAIRSVGGGRQLVPMRRTLQKRGGNRMLENSMVVGVSMDPVDKLDTELLECTSSVTLGTPSECSPIHGAMTAWITSAQQQRLRQLVDTDSKEEQEAMLLNTVQSYIEQNQDSYLNDDLLHVAYIGQRNLTVGDVKTPDPVRGTEQIDMNPSQKAGMTAGFIGLTVAAVVLAMVAVGAAWTYRRRHRRRNQVDENGFDLEQGAFPVLTPEFESYRLNGEDDTQDALPPPDEEVAYNNLFGLNGPTSDGDDAENPSDDAVEEKRLVSLSSLAALGAASTLARQLSYSPVTSPQESTDEQDVAHDSALLDEAPNTQDSHSVDIVPLSPMTANEDNSDSSVDSSVFEAVNEDEVAPVPAVSPSESTVPAKNDSDTMPEEEDDGDDSQQSGVLV
eukprot:CAMPEP_0172297760 /NCGR_PEP_ID=MMETSP1058-20130122/668_1 /TAXON_ID=83371 /ORGANISM="Detonula confervacea, Strain CCMP 353" /LENGTH=574 /DNA_ID=CAMNT_0013006949 /DNA_START=96 /DNA_END=1820 /DNA_ORIENTATION=-